MRSAARPARVQALRHSATKGFVRVARWPRCQAEHGGAVATHKQWRAPAAAAARPLPNPSVSCNASPLRPLGLALAWSKSLQKGEAVASPAPLVPASAPGKSSMLACPYAGLLFSADRDQSLHPSQLGRNTSLIKRIRRDNLLSGSLPTMLAYRSRTLYQGGFLDLKLRK